jgi:hypothetical protein
MDEPQASMKSTGQNLCGTCMGRPVLFIEVCGSSYLYTVIHIVQVLTLLEANLRSQSSVSIMHGLRLDKCYVLEMPPTIGDSN